MKKRGMNQNGKEMNWIIMKKELSLIQKKKFWSMFEVLDSDFWWKFMVLIHKGRVGGLYEENGNITVGLSFFKLKYILKWFY